MVIQMKPHFPTDNRLVLANQLLRGLTVPGPDAANELVERDCVGHGDAKAKAYPISYIACLNVSKGTAAWVPGQEIFSEFVRFHQRTAMSW